MSEKRYSMREFDCSGAKLRMTDCCGAELMADDDNGKLYCSKCFKPIPYGGMDGLGTPYDRPWPVLVISANNEVHISDEDVESGHKCRCGRVVPNDFKNLHRLTQTGGDNGCDHFAAVRDVASGQRLCAACGTAEDFDAAVDKFHREIEKDIEKMLERARRKAKAKRRLEAELAEVLDGLAKNQLKDFSPDCEDGLLVFWAGDLKFSVEPLNFYELIDAAAADVN